MKPVHGHASPRRVRGRELDKLPRGRVEQPHVGPPLQDEPPVRRAAAPLASGLRQVELVHGAVRDVEEGPGGSLAARVVREHQLRRRGLRAQERAP